MSLKTDVDVHVRSIDSQVWTALRMEAVRRHVSVAKLIEELWKERERTPVLVKSA